MEPKVLVVGIDPQYLKELGTIMREEGYDVELAVNGKMAMNTIKRKIFDLILMDVLLPELNSFESCAIIRNQFKTIDTPIVCFKEADGRKSRVSELDCGVQGYVEKPFDTRDLIRCVKTQIRLKESREKLRALNRDLDSYCGVNSSVYQGDVG